MPEPQQQPQTSSIRLMDDVLASQVAAGEVVERPASVVKELVENSIDAGARSIRVEIRRGGVSLLKVTDDGSGMSREDASLCLLRHATSKLTSFDDLFNIRQLGFRGEALPSIASVSHLRITTRRAQDVEGTLISCEGGVMAEPMNAGCAPGTEIAVSNLFYNTPVRRKFLKGDETEAGHVEHQLRLYALAFPGVRFTFVREGLVVFDTPATHDLRLRIAAFAGHELAARLMRIRPTEAPGVRVEGFLLPLSEARRNRRLQYIFLNGRPVEDKIVSRAIRDGFGGFPTGLHPALFLYLEVDPGLVDVNVHPAKREVRFRRPADVTTAIIDAIASTLASHARGGAPDEAPATPAQKPEPTPPPAEAQPAPVALPLPPREAVRSRRSEVAAPSGTAAVHPNAGAEHPACQPVPLRLVAEPRQRELELARPEAPAPVAPPQPLAEAGASAQVLPTTPPSLPNFRHVGTLKGQYALFENSEGLVLLSPRAARERVIFERLMAAGRRPMLAQSLLMPALLEMDARDMGIARELLPQLERAGFRLSVFGRQTLRVEAVPSLLPLREVESFMQKLFTLFTRGEVRLNRTRNPYEPFAMQLARQYARQEDLAALLREPMPLLVDLLRCEIPYCTPNGKPTLVPFSLAEINRKFQSP